MIVQVRDYAVRNARALIWLCAGIAGVALAAWCIGAAKPSSIGSLGLVSATGWPYVVGLGAIYLAAFGSLALDKRAPLWVGGVLLLSAFSLVQLSPLIVEGTARYVYSYRSFGFGYDIAAHHAINGNLFYLNWPGLHLVTAFLEWWTGTSPASLIATSSIVFEASRITLVYAAARGIYRDPRSPWLAVLGALLLKQSLPYYVPTSAAQLLLLVVVVVLSSGGRRLRRSEAMVIGLVVLAAPVVHLLSAIFLMAFLGLLALFRRSRAIGRMCLLSAAALGLWTGLGTARWTFGTMLPRLLQLMRGGGAESTLSGISRLAFSGSDAHALVVVARLAFALIVFAAAAYLGVVGARSHRAVGIPAAGVLASASIVMTGPYGGEILARMYGFALPFVALMVPMSLELRASRTIAVAAVAALSAASPLFIFGNEVIDYVRPGELVALDTARQVVAGNVHISSEPDRVWGAYFVRDIFLACPADVSCLKIYIEGGPVQAQRQFVGLSGPQAIDRSATSTVLSGPNVQVRLLPPK